MRSSKLCFVALLLVLSCTQKQKHESLQDWEIGPFVKVDSLNPILGPLNTKWFCPVRQDSVHWEAKDVFNPCAVVRDGKVYMLYRAEDIEGKHNGTSRIGLAVSSDGLNFERYPMPVFYPEEDEYKSIEWEGGVEDPRIVEDENGTYYMTYTAYDGEKTRLCIATSDDLIVWRKHGVVFDEVDEELEKTLSFKSGLIVSKLIDEKMIATKINGKYWMYWNVGELYLATSDDLIHWKPVMKEDGSYYAPALQARPDKLHVDNIMCEPGPAALLTDKGILVLYNGISNGVPSENGRPDGDALTWAGVQVLYDANDPLKPIARAEDAFIRPEKDYELTGQVNSVTFIEGMVRFKGRWFIYYGTADSYIAVAVTEE
jgi:beta-1,2-mannosidase